MTADQSAAFVMCAAARAFAKIHGMTAENQQRLVEGKSLAYTEEAFLKIITEEGIDHNSVLSLFHG